MQIFQTILINPFLNALTAIYGIIPGHDFGLSVIILTILLRLALWPLANKQLHSQKKLQALQPEIAKIKHKAAGDKQKENTLMMELYKEKEINPFSACLPILLQFPFLIALYFVFTQAAHGISTVTTNLYPFVKNIPYIQQIITNPSLFDPDLFNLVSMAQPSKALAILAGLSQFAQVYMITPKKTPGPKDPTAQTTMLMNYLFPAFTVFIAWNLPAALPLYWTVTNLMTILQQALVMRGEVTKMEEAKIVSRRSLKPAKQPTAKTKAKAKKKARK